MSTRAATLPASTAPAKRGSSLTRPWHGLPVWTWVLGGTVVGYLLWTKVLHKSSATTPATVSGAPATGGTGVVTTGVPGSGGFSGGGGSSGGGGTPVTSRVTEQFPGGGSYSGPPTTAPPFPTTTPLSTTPAPAKTPIAGTFQRAPTGNVFAATGKVFSPIQTWQKTLTLISHGVKVFLRTTSTGQAYPVTASQLAQIEHTGTHAFPQYVTYTTSAGATSSSAVRPGGAEKPAMAKTTLRKPAAAKQAA